ncbi:hypothetical protein WJX73_004246 [Symbiochloris irregularis]|uniref:Rhodanese domain-containing protein n=1 Tax=Symbiochloris irregularis TaxID=706552 RepID=A0AAW1PC98_9CHLO
MTVLQLGGTVQKGCAVHSQSRQALSIRPRTRHSRLQTARAAPETAVKEETQGEEKIRFKWDAANQRWKRVTADMDETDKYSLEKWEEGGVGVIQTKTGGTYTVWPIIHAKLTAAKLKSVSTQEASDLVGSKGAVLVDGRSPWNHEKESIPGSINLPLFLDVAGTSFWDNLKKFVVRFGMNMRATERDPKFREKLAKLDKSKTYIVYCGLGGTLYVGVKPYKPGGKQFKNDPERQFGRESRSLKVCYELQEAGFKNVLHLEGGLSQWRHDGFPTE